MRDWITVVKVAKYREPQTPPKAVITVTTLGYAKKEKVVYRSGAQQNDLVCITGNLGAAYMGLQLLEREKRGLADVLGNSPSEFYRN